MPPSKDNQLSEQTKKRHATPPPAQSARYMSRRTPLHDEYGRHATPPPAQSARYMSRRTPLHDEYGRHATPPPAQSARRRYRRLDPHNPPEEVYERTLAVQAPVPDPDEPNEDEDADPAENEQTTTPPSDVDGVRRSETNPLENPNPQQAQTLDKEKQQLGLYTPDLPGSKQAPKATGRLSFSRRQGIASLVAGGLLGGSFFFGIGALPGLTIVNLKEVGVQKLGGSIETVIDNRDNSIYVKKINTSAKTPTINTMCAKGIKVGCRFQGMSDKEITKLTERARGAGVTIDIQTSDTKNILGKRSVRTINVDGKALSAAEFADEITKPNSATSKAMSSLMQPRFASWAGKNINNLMSKLGISKVNNLARATSADEVNKELAARQKGSGSDIDTTTRQQTDDTATEEEKAKADIANKNADILTDGQNTTNRLETAALDSLDDAPEQAAKTFLGSVGKGLMITGNADTACTAVNTISALGYLSKAVGVLQLIRFAMTFSSTADAIKVGDATPEAIEAIGQKLSALKSNTSLSAFDSYGYQWLAYGKVGNPTDTAEFKVGGGLPATMTSFANKVKTAIPGGSQACNFIQNPGVRIGSAVVGIAAAIFSGGTITVGSIAQSGAIGAGLALIQGFSLPIIADIMAGKYVNPDTTVGDRAGNAFVSGLGALYAQNNNATGLAPLTIKQAVAFDQGPKATYLARVKQESIEKTGQFDPTNPNSFAGRLTTQLASTFSSRSPLTAGSKLFALVTHPIATTASAEDDPEAQYHVCTDDEYKQLGVATDPFCNPVYGLSPTALAMDPDVVIETMHKEGYIDDDGAPQGLYSDFVEQCANNTNPLGFYSDDTSDKVKPESCVPGKTIAGKADKPYPEEFWVYTIDSNIYEKSQCIIEDDAAACGTPSTNTAPTQTAVAGSGDKIGDFDPGRYSCAEWIGKRVLPKIYGLGSTAGSGLGNGNQIAINIGRKWGYTVNNTPAVHSIVSFPAYCSGCGAGSSSAGHVGVVSAVNADGSVEIEDYNVVGYMQYGTWTIKASVVPRLTYAHVESEFGKGSWWQANRGSSP